MVLLGRHGGCPPFSRPVVTVTAARILGMDRWPRVRRVYFVSRWREESPFSKRVVTVPDTTVLGWFRRGWKSADPEAWIAGELGGHVYRLDSIFDEAQKRNLPEPQSIDELRELLHEHLWVEGDTDFIRLGEHALTVRTDDDEVDLAYYFIDDKSAAALPERLAFLLHDTWPLPTDAAASGAVFSPGIPVRTVRLAPPGPEAVFSVCLCWESPDVHRNLNLVGAMIFPGLTLPELAARLRGTDGPGAHRWPHDARLLRALVAPGEDDISPAMERYARLGGYAPAPAGIDRPLAHEAIHGEMPAMLRSVRPDESLTRLDVHITQVARYIDGFFGFDQWFLFDTRWAATHPDLARSLLRYATYWDPYAV
ncbi:hypothetical protein SAMN04489713_1387 [Actinomadura madurae]|uniref:Uncharacterized protein n=2 Tax=Actinomadura madurae TaxID=1993 RepID=A0A1I5YUN5_9ACTN|nr:hypothetical protein SAMN04489713_1387 [Actinomadura madurae]SPT51841.1 Uncharacterised protein [Actinomadura madurae]